MKRLDQLQILVKKLTQKEVSQFKKYCDYKSKKKILKLFNLFVKYKEESTTERLQISIKRSGLQRNLRRRVTELFELIIHYLEDSTTDIGAIRKANKTIQKALVLSRKGLRNEACKILEQVIKETQGTVNVEQTLLALRLLYSYNTLHEQNVPELSVEFSENQSKLAKKITEFNEIQTLYRDGLFWLNKGLEMLEKDELNQLLEIRKRGVEIIENQELPFSAYMLLGSLLATLCEYLPPANFQLAEHYHLNILKRFEEVDGYYNLLNYYGMYQGYMNLLSTDKRVEDYKTHHKKMLEEHAKTKTYNVTIVGIFHVVTLGICQLDYNADRADEMLNKALEYVDINYYNVQPSAIRNILFICFELTIIKADLNHAGLIIDQLNKSKSFSKFTRQFNLTVRIAELLLNYEKKNYQWVINQEDSIKRLYSRQLKVSGGKKLLLNLLIRLSSTPNRKEKSILLTKFLQELTTLFEQHPEQRFTFHFSIIEDWAAAKLNGNHSIMEYKT